MFLLPIQTRPRLPPWSLGSEEQEVSVPFMGWLSWEQGHPEVAALGRMGTDKTEREVGARVRQRKANHRERQGVLCLSGRLAFLSEQDLFRGEPQTPHTHLRKGPYCLSSGSLRKRGGREESQTLGPSFRLVD